MLAFDLPDTTTSLPALPVEFSPSARQPAREVLDGGIVPALRLLLRDQESQVSALVARRVLDAFRAAGPAGPTGGAPDPDPESGELDADAIAGRVLGLRSDLTRRLERIGGDDAEVREAVLRQRAPIALLGGCWLDTVSQPATQPAVVVNRLFAHHFRLQGEGNLQRGVHHLRRGALEREGVFLPDIDAVDFLTRAQTRPLTALHATFYLSLSRVAASLLPEVVGVHYVYHALGIDELLLGTPRVLAETELRAALGEYVELTRDRPGDRRRLLDAVRLAMRLETEHVALLDELASYQANLPLEAKVAAIIERHAPYAGRQHRDVRVAGHRLADLLGAPDLDAAEFARILRNSRQLKPIHGGDGRFLRAIRFGGPMFGIFDEREAAVFRSWAEAAAAGTLPDVPVPPNRVGDEDAARWSAAIEATEPSGVVFVEADPAGDRELFHRIVNIETYPNTLPLAKARAQANLDAAEALFEVGARGRYTDASWLDYTPDALLRRVESIYWDKLVNPYRPLEEIPDRQTVIFQQKTYALGSMVDGAWAHRIGNVGRYRRISDGMLAAIYADEMGRGDLAKNHITLIHRVLRSLGIDVPHIRDAAFLDQGELPDHLYGFSIHQLCLALFPDTFYNEILGYNLGIEMFGLGELRMHEMQKLSHHGFDTSYEQAHLSIDNFSAGHARQSADIIIAFLDEVARTVGEEAVQREWRRVWRGYASFAYFIEHHLIKEAASHRTAELVI